ncbi:FmdB family transcriptional regulator [Mycobacterium sp. SM1]|uniref:FmdB family zinc ribbon protein n=1 Tax=Mycobacterium sp. SM1 TaxID=2816243 RepID=UPI001BCF1DD8|nr:FmdB family zinc ribbon protein [Mycobacterium sp. SM1]MBS4729155.1 FmdB family transcriptional regulator [Mycobacterium sp. SM1]
MPTYSYACTQCGDRFDVVQALTDDALTTCRRCSGRLRKLFNSVGIVFKGSGFYRTDSREPAKGSTAGSTKAPSAESATSGSAEKSSASAESASKTAAAV